MIEIPFSIPYEEIPEYILNKCKEKSVEVPEITKEIDFDKIINDSYVISIDKKDYSQSQMENYLPDEAEDLN